MDKYRSSKLRIVCRTIQCFPLKKATKQSDPFSTYLFTLALEIAFISIEKKTFSNVSSSYAYRLCKRHYPFSQ